METFHLQRLRGGHDELSSDALEVDGVLIVQRFQEGGHETNELHREDQFRIQGSCIPETLQLRPMDARDAEFAVRNGWLGRR